MKRNLNSQRKIKKINTFVEFTKNIANLSVSQRDKVGCIALHKDFTKIGAFGYNGRYPGAPTSLETGGEELSLEPGKSGFTHAEQNMIAKFKEPNPQDYIIIITLSPCLNCSQLLVISGFKYVFWMNEYRDDSYKEIFNNCKINYGNIDKLINLYVTTTEPFKF